MKKQPLKLALIGGSINSAIGQIHVSAAQLDGKWEIVAGAFSTSLDFCHETAYTWGLQEIELYDDWRKMLNEIAGEIDAVAVLTPTPLHFEMVVELLEAGLPVICEKALVSSVEEAQSLRKLYNPQLHFLAVTYNYSGYPMVRELKHLIELGELGQIQQIYLEMPQEGFLRPPVIEGKQQSPQSWRCQDGNVPTICLDLGVHLHHLAEFLTGLSAIAVMADMEKYSSWGVIDQVHMLLRYEKKVQGFMWMTKTALGERNGLKIRIFGSKGAATWVQSQPEELYLAYQDGRRMQLDRGGAVHIANARRYTRMKPGHPSGFLEAFANLYWDLADAVIAWRMDACARHPYVFGLEHAYEGLHLFDCARRSYETEKWMKL